VSNEADGECDKDPIPAVRSPVETTEHWVEVPGGSIYYRCQGSSGPSLILIGGGPANADTLAPLALALADERAVVTYDRRGYSRSRVDDGDRQVDISTHGDDLRLLIVALDRAPVSVFGTSFGALIALNLAARFPQLLDIVIVHEPPLGQVLADSERQAFDVDTETEPDAESALDAIAVSVGITRGRNGDDRGSREPRVADIALFIRRDVPAIGAFHLDLDQLKAVSDRIVITGSEEGRGFYPYRCAQRLADLLGTPLVELPGNHAGMIQHPAGFASRLRSLLNRSHHGATTLYP
jgi:pimeloyl-ACP methyl ester carboxylesterase